MGGILGVSRCRAARLATALAVLWFGWLAAPPAGAAEAVLVGAGDIAKCGSFHHPRFSSDEHHGNSWQVAPFWEALYEHGADLILSGHAHSYERFAPQTPWGKHDPSHGIRQIVVGTGGATLYNMGAPRPNSQVRNADILGVLKLNLSSDSFRWSFIPQPGKRFRDSGHGKCHGRPGLR